MSIFLQTNLVEDTAQQVYNNKKSVHDTWLQANHAH